MSNVVLDGTIFVFEYDGVSIVSITRIPHVSVADLRLWAVSSHSNVQTPLKLPLSEIAMKWKAPEPFEVRLGTVFMLPNELIVAAQRLDHVTRRPL